MSPQTCMFIRTCETFCSSTRSANGNSDLEVKSVYVPSGLSGQRSFHFL